MVGEGAALPPRAAALGARSRAFRFRRFEPPAHLEPPTGAVAFGPAGLARVAAALVPADRAQAVAEAFARDRPIGAPGVRSDAAWLPRSLRLRPILAVVGLWSWLQCLVQRLARPLGRPPSPHTPRRMRSTGPPRPPSMSVAVASRLMVAPRGGPTTLRTQLGRTRDSR
jgi:hypothetical protein